MKAILLTRARHVEVVDDWPEPEPGAGEVVVAMRAVGLCGSDLSVYEGDRAVPRLPWVMGHEGGGEIVAVGSGVIDRRVGQRVVIEPNYCCLGCPGCVHGLTSACDQRRIVGMNVPGLLAERVAVPARFAWPVSPSFSDETLACVEPLAVARAAVRRSGTRPHDRCLVVGSGSQGLLVCQALLELGARVYVTEPHESRMSLAVHMGARRAGPTDRRAFSVVFDTVGEPDAWETSIRSVANAGTIVMIGMSPRPARLSTLDLTRRQLVIRGSLIYDHPGDFAATLADIGNPERVLRPGTDPEAAADAFAQARKFAGKPWIRLAAWQEAR